MTPRPEVVEQVLALLRHRGTATQKEILNAGGDRRDVREERFWAIEQLLTERRIEIISQRWGVSTDGSGVGTKHTRYALTRGQS